MLRLDNFTTARCKKCGFVKQFQPGREYDSSDFKCDCKVDMVAIKEEVTTKEKLIAVATKLGVKKAKTMREDTLKKKIKELENES